MYIKKCIGILFIVLSVFLAGCSSSFSEESSSAQNDDNEQKTENEPETWYIMDGILYVNEIHYTITNGHISYKKPWSKYVGDVTGLVVNADMICVGEEGIKKDIPTNTSTGPFANMDNIKTANICINMNGVKDASFMLAACDSLESASVSISGDVEYATYVFVNCKELKSASFSISGSASQIQSMFEGCESLTDVSLGINNSPSRCGSMFEDCKSLEKVTIPFDISEETSFIDMFAFCDSLTTVNFSNVKVNSGGQNFFNNINSISDYTFAESWEVDVENLANPIGEGISYSIIIPIDGKGSMMEAIVYEKARPTWLRSYTEITHQLEVGWDMVFSEPVLDIYIHYVSQESADKWLEKPDKAIDDAMKELYKNLLVEIDKKEGTGVIADSIEGAEMLYTLAYGEPDEQLYTLIKMQGSLYE